MAGRGILGDSARRQPQHRSVPATQTWRFAQRALGVLGVQVWRHPSCDGSPSLPLPPRPGRRPTYLTAVAGHRGHNRGPKRSPEQPILGRALRGAPKRAFQNRTRRLRGPISSRRGVRGVFWLLPFPPPASKPKCEIPASNQRRSNSEGRARPGSFPCRAPSHPPPAAFACRWEVPCFH